LPVDEDTNAPNVEEQEKNPKSLLNNVRKLIQIKKSESALAAYAEFVPVYAKEDTYPFIFARAAGNEIILAIFNPSAKDETAEFKLNINAREFKLLSGAQSQLKNNGNKYTLNIKGQSYSLFKFKK